MSNMQQNPWCVCGQGRYILEWFTISCSLSLVTQHLYLCKHGMNVSHSFGNNTDENHDILRNKRVLNIFYFERIFLMLQIRLYTGA